MNQNQATQKLVVRENKDFLNCHRYRRVVGCGKLYIFVTYDDTGPFEIFAMLGKSGQCGLAQVEAITRMATIALRAGIEPIQIVKQLRGIQCPSPYMLKTPQQILSCGDAIASALREEIETFWTPQESGGTVD